ncbi:MAG TPA: aminoacyl-tRNA hydrolase [Cellvibrionaceae bacterium]
MSSPVQLIVGLGNPGPDYARTRHNAGADWVESLAQCLNTPLVSTPKFFGLSGRASLPNGELRLLIPTTYMNRSGQSVAALAQFYKIPPEAILVAHDELDLAPGIARLKQGGGHGGHNGLRDIIASLSNNPNFMRLRLGIGHPGQAKQVADYVLKRAPQAEAQLTLDASEKALAIREDLFSGQWDKALRTLHSAS